MNMDFVTYEISKKVKEKGFPLVDYIPTISQVLKWLREEKELHIRVSVYFIGWCVDVTNMDGKRMYSTECEYNSFEQAAIAGIEYVINNLI